MGFAGGWMGRTAFFSSSKPRRAGTTGMEHPDFRDNVKRDSGLNPLQWQM